MAKKKDKIKKLALKSSDSLDQWEDGATAVEPTRVDDKLSELGGPVAGHDYGLIEEEGLVAGHDHGLIEEEGLVAGHDHGPIEEEGPVAGHDHGPIEEEGRPADNISRRSSDAGDIYTPQASQSESNSDNQIALDGDSNLDTLKCDYLTPIVHVYLGSKEMCFLVHRGVLAQSSFLASKCKRIDGTETLRLPEVEPELFVLLLTYLYKWDYHTSQSAESVEDRSGNDAVAEFKTHAKVYCLASAYKLDRLVNIAIKNMEAVGRIGFRNLIEIAREIYPDIQAEDVWFTTYFKNEVTWALTETPEVARDQHILDIYRNDGGRLAVDLYTTIIAQYVHHGAQVDNTIDEPEIPESTPNTDEVIRCEKRTQHLRSLKKKGQWSNCQICRSERDQMITFGHAVLSVAINDLLPAIYSNQAADQIANAAVQPSTETKTRKVKTALKALASKVISITSTVFGQTVKDYTRQCPDQAEHLKKRGGRWQWENCPRCLEDRAQILREFQSNLNQQIHEQPILLHSEEQIMPENAVGTNPQEIGPAEPAFQEDDAPAADPAVIDCSSIPPPPGIVPDMNHPLQSMDPIGLESDTLACPPLDIDGSQECNQKIHSSQVCRTEEATVDELHIATESLIDFGVSPSLPQESISDRTADVSVAIPLDPVYELILPEAEAPAVDHWDHLATAQHAALHDTLAEVPRMAINTVVECSPETTLVVDIQVGDISSEYQEKQLNDEWASSATSKGKKKKRTAFAPETFDASNDQAPEPEEQEPKKPEWWSLPLNQLSQSAKQPEEQAQYVDSCWGDWGSAKKENTIISSGKISFPSGEILMPEELEEDSPDQNASRDIPSDTKQMFKQDESEPTQDAISDFAATPKTKKSKKKSKRDEPEPTKDDIWSFEGFSVKEDIVPVEGDIKATDWEDFSSEKKKKKKSKLSTVLAETTFKDAEERIDSEPARPETLPVLDNEDVKQYDWSFSPEKKKKKKQSKLSTIYAGTSSKEAEECTLAEPAWPDASPVPDKEDAKETDWGVFILEKKKKKSRLSTFLAETSPVEAECTLSEPARPETPPAETWQPSIFSFKKQSVYPPEPEPLFQSCLFRMSHLADESRWSNCTLCRRELSLIAQKLVRGDGQNGSGSYGDIGFST